jgi:hypothetical protein
MAQGFGFSTADPVRRIGFHRYNDQKGPSTLLYSLGFLEGQNLYNAFNFQIAAVQEAIGNTPTNSTVLYSRVKTFLRPSNPFTSVYPYSTNYASSYGPRFRWDATPGGLGTGLFVAEAVRGINQVTDGTSNTIAFTEVNKGEGQSPSRNHTEIFRYVSWPTCPGGTGNGGYGTGQVATYPDGYANLRTYIALCDAHAKSPGSAANELDQASEFWSLARCTGARRPRCSSLPIRRTKTAWISRGSMIPSILVTAPTPRRRAGAGTLAGLMFSSPTAASSSSRIRSASKPGGRSEPGRAEK